MNHKIPLITTLLLLVCSTLFGQSTTSTKNEPEFFRFNLENQQKGVSVKQPELVLPNGNPYAMRIESKLAVDIPAVTEKFLLEVDVAINKVIDKVTSGHLEGRVLLQQKGLEIDPLDVAKSSDVFLQQHTPILEGQASEISNYHLIAVVDLKPLQSQMQQLWKEVMLGERLIQYIMIASIVLIILFLFRGNQVMRHRDTNRAICIVVNISILAATVIALGVIATMLHWV